MISLISLAHAQSAAAPAPGGAAMIQQFLPLIIIFILFWFMLIRPQMKRAKEQKKMLAELAKGDEVVTASGQVGKIVKIGDQYVSLEISDGVITHVQKQSVQTLLPKGTIKGL
jgi:preprotein translocase subunit YajC